MMLKNWSFRALRMNLPLPRRFYRKSLVLVLLAICVPTIAVGSGVKWIGTRQMEKLIFSSRQHQVSETAVRLDEAFSNLEKNATQWAFNPDFGYKLKHLETQYDFQFIRNIYTNLLLIKESNLLIEHADIYLDRPGVLLTDSDGTMPVREEDKSRYHDLLGYPQTTFWLTSFRPASNPKDEEGALLTLVYQLPANSDGEPFGALLIHLKRSQVSAFLTGTTLDGNGLSFMMDEEGGMIGSSSEEPQATRLRNELIRRVNAREAAADESPVIRVEGKPYLVTHTDVRRLGKSWTYVRADSLDSVHSPIVAASNFVYLFGGAVLLLAIAAAILVSRKLYQPIRTLIDLFRSGNAAPGGESADEIAFIEEQWKRLNLHSRVLEERLQKQLPVMKEGFLLQLLQGHFEFANPSELGERMKLFGMETEWAGYAVFGIRLASPAQPDMRFREGDRELVAFAALNIAEEMLREAGLRGQVVNLHDLWIGVILTYPPDRPEEERKAERKLLAERLADALYRFLRLPVAVCIGTPVDSANGIPHAWEEAKRLFRYRDMLDAKQVIQAEDFTMQMSEEIRYPFAAEAEVMQAVRRLDEEGAARSIALFCKELQAGTTKKYLFQQGVLQLLGNLRSGMLKAGYNPFESEAFALQEEMDKGIDIAGIVELFRGRVIRPCILKIRQDTEDQETRLQLTIEQVLEEIRERYGDPDLSLDRLAEEHGMTPLALSKAFRKATGINFIAYLTDLRLRRSKALLSETEHRINDIAETVGYQPTYFNWIFKKNEGVTPGRYRELMQGKGR